MAEDANVSVTVLGSCGAWPEPGRACSGFLVERDGYRLVLDLGYGTASHLLAALGNPAADGLDAVVVTHHHPDHSVDLHALFRARWFGRRGAAPIPLLAPRPVLDQLVALEDGDAGPLAQVFDWRRLPATEVPLGPFRLTALDVPHFVPAVGVRLAMAGAVVAYTGDTGPSPVLAELARDADLFIAEASDRSQRPDVPPAPPGPPLHLDSASAGRVATEAGAKRLMLTHFWPGNDRARSAAAAEQHYAGPVLLAEEGLTVRL